MELFAAHNQWATRPDDQRFSSVADMHRTCLAYAEQAREKPVSWGDVRILSDEDDIIVELGTGEDVHRARFSHWAFVNLCSRIKAPAEYLTTLSTELAARCLNANLTREAARGGRGYKALLHENGGLLLRAFTSVIYTRIWNWEICEKLLNLPDGWRVPPARPARLGQAGSRPATAADVLAASDFGLSVAVGDLIAPAGLYASDADMFAFFVNENARIDDGSPDGLSRGFFVENSEVGKMAYKLTCFHYRHCCGNHIVWGAQDVQSVRVRHVGLADIRAWEELQTMLDAYANLSAAPEEALIRGARRFLLGANKKETTVKVYKHLSTTVPMGALESAWDLTAVNRDEDGDPNTSWGLAQGMTRLAQALPFADKRVMLDRGAGKVLEMSFN